MGAHTDQPDNIRVSTSSECIDILLIISRSSIKLVGHNLVLDSHCVEAGSSVCYIYNYCLTPTKLLGAMLTLQLPADTRMGRKFGPAPKNLVV